MQIRPHSSSLAGSMSMCREIPGTPEALKEHISNSWPQGMTLVGLTSAGFDARINWNTFYVVVKFPDGTQGVFGMTDQDTSPSSLMVPDATSLKTPPRQDQPGPPLR